MPVKGKGNNPQRETIIKETIMITTRYITRKAPPRPTDLKKVLKAYLLELDLLKVTDELYLSIQERHPRFKRIS
jgi:hypothetical protein